MKNFMRNMALLFCLAGNSLIAKSTQEVEVSPQSTFEQVSSLYLQSLASTEMKEKAEAEKIQSENAKKVAAFQFAGVKESMGSVEQLRTAYLLHQLGSYGKDDAYLTTLAPNTLTDLSLFYGDKITPDNHVFAQINKTQTISGRVALQTMLAQPIYSIATLKNRQAFVRLLIEDKQLYKKIRTTLEIIKTNEAAFLSIAREMQAEVTKHFRDVMFDCLFLKNLNHSPTLMHGGTYMLAGRELAFSVILDAIVLGIIFALNNDIGMRFFDLFYGPAFLRDPSRDNFFLPFMTYLNLGIGIYQLANRLPTIGRLKQKMASVAKVLVSAHRDLANQLAKYPVAQKALPELDANSIEQVRQQTATQVLAVLENLDTSFLQAGHAVTAFERKQEIKDNFVNSYRLIGLVDAYTSIATLMKEFADSSNATYCFVDYIKEQQPCIALSGFWHPMLNPDTVVKNDITLGTNSMPRNGMITGPNAGGKTTVLRSIALAVLMGQTLGIAAADKATMTPFCNFATYLDVADSEGKESLFQAEMHRMQSLLNSIKELKNNEFSIMFTDEMFTGTNPKEGIAAAYGVCKKLSTYPNNISLLTTHFIDLTSLAAETGSFTNYKVTVRTIGDKFEFPYKLEFGITDQAIALQLLNQEGFDSDILASANAFMNRKQTPGVVA